MSSLSPVVSVGLPVYNGARWLDSAIRSILTQTFTDLELIICDNASTDSTPEICQKWAAQDTRVRFVRNQANIGLIPNHNLTFSMSRGEYFLWFSYDDVHLPDSIAQRVALLREHPEVVLVYSGAETINDAGTIIPHESHPFHIDSADPEVRFEAAINRIPPEETAIYGLIRREILVQTLLLRNCHGADGCLLAELSLRGRIYKLPTVLFHRRLHANNVPTSQEVPWRFRQELSGKLIFPQWRITVEDIRTVCRVRISWMLRLRVFGIIIRRVISHRSLMKTELGFAWYYFKQRLQGKNPTLSPADRAARESRMASL